jgi:hypothetical protein
MSTGVATAVGAALGAAYGAETGDLALWVAGGAAVGALLDVVAHMVKLARRRRAQQARQL